MLTGQKQNAWKLPAVLNLTLGGMGAGLYLLTLLLIFPNATQWSQHLAQTAIFKLSGPILVCIGLLALTTEAGHPMKSIYLLANLRHSWMSREALAAGIFILAAGLDWLFPSPILQGIAAISGLGFMVSQGMIVWRASGVVTWNTSLVPLFFLTCGLATGSGIFLITNYFLGYPTFLPVPILVIVVAIANGGVWLGYLNLHGVEFQRGIAALRKPVSLFLTIVIGHILPVILLVCTFFIGMSLGPVLAGVGLLFGGVFQKFSFAFEGSGMRSVIR